MLLRRTRRLPLRSQIVSDKSTTYGGVSMSSGGSTRILRTARLTEPPAWPPLRGATNPRTNCPGRWAALRPADVRAPTNRPGATLPAAPVLGHTPASPTGSRQHFSEPLAPHRAFGDFANRAHPTYEILRTRLKHQHRRGKRGPGS